MSLADDLKSYKKAELKRLSSELKFSDRITNSVAKVLDAVIKDVHTSTTAAMQSKTSLAEDNDVALSMIKSAIAKSVDPTIQTTVSDSVNRNLGEVVGKTIGRQEAANLVASISNTAQKPANTGLATTPQGGYPSASELSSDIYDMSKKMQQKVLNTVSLALTNKPGLLPEFAMLSINFFVTAAHELASAFARHAELVATIKVDTAALDETYYANDVFSRTRNAKTTLQSADEKLLTVRQEVIKSPSVFHAEVYKQVRDAEMFNAVGQLVNYGNSNNKVVEIKGAMDALDYLMINIEELYDDFYQRLSSLANYFDSFSVHMKFNGSMFVQVNQVQAEIRSIMRSMDAALYLNKASTMPTMERVWYMELLSLYNKMLLSPTNIQDYLDEDPDGYIASYNPIAEELRADLEAFSEDMKTLKSLTEQLKYWAQRKLTDTWPNNPQIQENIDNISTTIQNTCSDNIVLINITIEHATSYNVPLTDLPMKILDMMLTTRMNNALNYLQRGQWSKFFSVTPDNASTSAQLSSSINQAMSSAVSTSTSASGASSPPITFSSIEAMTEAQYKIQDQKRAEDLLAAVTDRFKGDGQQDIVDDIQDLLDTCAGVEQLDQYTEEDF